MVTKVRPRVEAIGLRAKERPFAREAEPRTGDTHLRTRRDRGRAMARVPPGARNELAPALHDPGAVRPGPPGRHRSHFPAAGNLREQPVKNCRARHSATLR